MQSKTQSNLSEFETENSTEELPTPEEIGDLSYQGGYCDHCISKIYKCKNIHSSPEGHLIIGDQRLCDHTQTEADVFPFAKRDRTAEDKPDRICEDCWSVFADRYQDLFQ
jgi:hypothetical protein